MESALKPIGKFGLALVAVAVLSVVIYLVAWVHVYLIAGVVWLLETIFT